MVDSRDRYAPRIGQCVPGPSSERSQFPIRADLDEDVSNSRPRSDPYLGSDSLYAVEFGFEDG